MRVKSEIYGIGIWNELYQYYIFQETVKKLVEEGVAKEASKKPLASLFRLKGKQPLAEQTQKKEKISTERKEGKVVKPPKLKAIKIRLGEYISTEILLLLLIIPFILSHGIY